MSQELVYGDFDKGFQLGAKVEHRVAVKAACNALLEILGKDAADGVINLGAAGTWAYDYKVERWERWNTVSREIDPLAT